VLREAVAPFDRGCHEGAHKAHPWNPRIAVYDGVQMLLRGVAQRTLLGSTRDLHTHQSCVSRGLERVAKVVFLLNSAIEAMLVGH
jgi:hypothetical protein